MFNVLKQYKITLGPNFCISCLRFVVDVRAQCSAVCSRGEKTSSSIQGQI